MRRSLLFPLFTCALSQSANLHVEARLQTALGSRTSHPGDRVSAVVIAPVRDSDRILPLEGATLSGTVQAATPVGLGLLRTVARISVHFDELRLSNGATVPVDGKICSIETARERVDGSGAVHGIDPAANLSSGFSFLLSTVLLHTELEAPAIAFKLLAARSPNSEIYLPQGSELFVSLSTSAPLEPESLTSLRPVTASEISAVASELDRLPSHQATLGKQPSDLVNLVMLGSKEQLRSAFDAAGWTGESPHNAMALYRMFHSMVQRVGYLSAPMSRMRLNGALPDSVFQKSLDTLAKRHHIRIWKGTGDSWLAAATEDVSIKMRGFHLTHAINPNVDSERAKVVNDLSFAGCVDEASLVARQRLDPIDRKDGAINTDGEVAVVRLGACDPSKAAPKPTRQHRCIGRALAAVGIDLLRANPFTVSVNAVRMAAAAIRRTPPELVAQAENSTRDSLLKSR